MLCQKRWKKSELTILNFANNACFTICKKASRQLNAISRIQGYIDKKEKEIINNFVYSHFMYYPLALHFCSKSFQNMIERIQYRSFKLITNDYNNDYKFLLNKTGHSTIEIKSLRSLAFEIFKTLNNLNPNFMENIFNFSPYSTHRKHDIFVHSQNTSNYGDRSLRALGPHT